MFIYSGKTPIYTYAAWKQWLYIGSKLFTTMSYY